MCIIGQFLEIVRFSFFFSFFFSFLRRALPSHPERKKFSCVRKAILLRSLVVSDREFSPGFWFFLMDELRMNKIEKNLMLEDSEILEMFFFFCYCWRRQQNDRSVKSCELCWCGMVVGAYLTKRCRNWFSMKKNFFGGDYFVELGALKLVERRREKRIFYSNLVFLKLK